MKVLFVRSGNGGRDPISTMQGDSLRDNGVDVFYYDIIGKGVRGYLRNILMLRTYIKKVSPDILHAHYSMSAYVASLTFSGKPQITSLMGGDVNMSKHKWIIRLFSYFFWKGVIVKSEEMKIKSKISDSHIIPNGVNLEIFKPITKDEARNFLGWSREGIIILFASNPDRIEKNWRLADVAIRASGLEIEVKYLVGVEIDQLRYYYSAADIILLTSLSEGSPNVIKEAMACNCPIVVTDVGDVRWILGDTNGCYITTFQTEDVTNKIKMALSYAKGNDRTKGRDRIMELGIDSKSVASKILSIYNEVIIK